MVTSLHLCIISLLQMPEQYKFAETLMNVLLVLSQTEFAKSIIHSGVMQHLWMQLLPPVYKLPEQIAEQPTASDKVSCFGNWYITHSWSEFLRHCAFCVISCICRLEEP